MFNNPMRKLCIDMKTGSNSKSDKGNNGIKKN